MLTEKKGGSMKKPLILPKFKNEDDEREFWSKISLADYFEPKDFKKDVIYPNLKPTSQAISIRLPKYLIFRLKQKANKMAVPYQALIKQAIYHSLEHDQ